MIQKHKCIQETNIALMKQKMDTQEKILKEIHEAVVGTDQIPGLKLRVDRMEQRHEYNWNITKLSLSILGALLALVSFLKR